VFPALTAEPGVQQKWCRDDRDTSDCDEEEAGADGRAGGGRRAGPTGPGAGLSLTGPDGLLKQLTKVVIETALDQELTEHLGHEKNTPAGNESGNVRNGSRPKTVLTEGTGQVGIEVPRDRDGTFKPQIVKKRQRRLNGVEEIVLSLYAKGLTTGEMGMYPWRRLLSWQNWASTSNGMKSSPWPKVTANVCLVFTSLAFMWTRHLLGEVAAPSFRPPPGMSA
jgi:hypothetical protein